MWFNNCLCFTENLPLKRGNKENWRPSERGNSLCWRLNFLRSSSVFFPRLHVCISMPRSYDKHGSNTQTDYFNSLQSLSLAVIYGKRSVRTLLDFRDKNAPQRLDFKCAPLSFLTNLRRFSKAKVVSFFLCLTLAFLIMVSYTLMLDKRRMPLMSSYRPSLLVVPTGAFSGEDVSTEKSFMSTELMVKIISSIQEHKPRRVPDKKEITETDSNVRLLTFCTVFIKVATAKKLFFV